LLQKLLMSGNGACTLTIVSEWATLVQNRAGPLRTDERRNPGGIT
jgi:hypothetical protein